MPRQHRRSPSLLEDRGRRSTHRQFKTPDCRLCHQDHPLRRCIKFKRMNVLEKLKIVKRHRYCENCLAHSHLINKCQNTDRCRQCGSRHHTLLHRHKRVQSTKPVPKTDGPSCSTPRTVTFVPTIVVKIKFGKDWANVRGILNSCAETSSIAEFLVDRYKIPVEEIGPYRWTKIVLRPRFDDDVVFTLSVKVTDELPQKQPKEPVDERVAKLYTNLRLADPYFYKNKDVNIILGADIYPRLIRSNIQQESIGTPMAHDTVLGWTIIGKFGV